MVNNRRTLVSRAKVRIVPTLQGTIYEVSESSNQFKVNIEQPERIESKIGISSNIKRSYFYTDNLNFKIGQFLPGNIYTEYRTKPITDDPEEHLLWVNGKVKRTFERNPIYVIYYYVSDTEYTPMGEIDPPIPFSG
jgi:hypothetical protein